MGQKKVIYTDGLADSYQSTQQGVLLSEQTVAAANRGEKRTKIARDYIDDQKVFENDELAPAWPNTRDTRRSTPESA